MSSLTLTSSLAQFSSQNPTHSSHNQEGSATSVMDDEQSVYFDALEEVERPHGDILPSYHMYEGLINCSLRNLSSPPAYSTDYNHDLENYDEYLVVSRGPLKRRLQELANVGSIRVAISLDQKWWLYVYYPGEKLSGVVILLNDLEQPVLLSQLYIVFDGCFSDCAIEVSFLEMVDLENLVTEPLVIEGKECRKIRFLFKIPSHYLDDDFQKQRHLQLPPSVNTGSVAVQYKVSCFVTRQEDGNRVKLGQNFQTLTISTQYHIESIGNDEYHDALRPYLLLTYLKRKLSSNDVIKSQLRELEFSFPYSKKNASWTLSLNQMDENIKGIMAQCVYNLIPRPFSQILTIPYQLTPSEYQLMSVNAELVLVDIVTPWCTLPLDLPQTMFFDPKSNRTFDEIVRRPLRNLLKCARKDQSTILNVLSDLLEMWVRYRRFKCPIATFTKTDIVVCLDGIYELKRMHRRDYNVNTNMFVPNFQCGCIGRTYYLSLVLEVGKGMKQLGKVVANVPVYFRG